MPPKRPAPTLTSFFKPTESSKRQAVGTGSKPTSTKVSTNVNSSTSMKSSRPAVASFGLKFGTANFDKQKWIDSLTKHQKELLEYASLFFFFFSLFTIVSETNNFNFQS